MKKYSWCIFLAAVSFYWMSSFGQGTGVGTIEQKALESALDWLKMMDAGKYKEGWQKCSDFLKNKADQAGFEKSLSGTFASIGKLLKREARSKQFFSRLPGASDGEYVVIKFNSKFERKEDAVETITMMKEKDGKLRVAGYSLK